MIKILNELQYEAVMKRIEELLPLVDDKTPEDDFRSLELDFLSAAAADYEEEHYKIETPSLAEVIKLRMYELGFNQKKIAELVGISPARLSEILSGKREPTYKVAQELCNKLSIDAAIALGLR